MIFTILDWASKMPILAFLIEIVSVSIFPQMPKNATGILGAHLNTSRATEMYLTFLELADIGRQDVVYHRNLSPFCDNRAKRRRHVLGVECSGRK